MHFPVATMFKMSLEVKSWGRMLLTQFMCAGNKNQATFHVEGQRSLSLSQTHTHTHTHITHTHTHSEEEKNEFVSNILSAFMCRPAWL